MIINLLILYLNRFADMIELQYVQLFHRYGQILLHLRLKEKRNKYFKHSCEQNF